MSVKVKDAQAIEGSRAIAKIISVIKPNVVAAYPITPQTHIVEGIAREIANGRLKTQFIYAESEFGAMSQMLGASAAGVRTYTATSSQGLMLMAEVLFTVAGMRLPVVMSVANRALSSPINIWNDHQDSISLRDSGWIQLYAETNQEAVDTTVMAFKIAEHTFLPVMVCMDGYTLTHTVEPVSIPSEAQVKRFLPDYNPGSHMLDPKNPVTMGPVGMPANYMEMRQQVNEEVLNSLSTIKAVNDEFHKVFGRKYGDGLIEIYPADSEAKTVVITLGSYSGNVKDIADFHNIKLVRLKSLRPFPKKELMDACENASTIIVMERDISLGYGGAIFAEVRSILRSERRKIVNIIAGLGGRDIPTNHIIDGISQAKKARDNDVLWLFTDNSRLSQPEKDDSEIVRRSTYKEWLSAKGFSKAGLKKSQGGRSTY